MDKKGIVEVFENLKIDPKFLSEYKDPYDFAWKIKKFTLLKDEKFTFAIGSISEEKRENAKLG